MEINTRFKVYGVIGLMIGSYALGRYMMPSPPAVTTKENTQTEVKKRETEVTIKLPNGETRTTKTIDTNITRDETKTSVVTPILRPKINLSALISNDLKNPGITPIYGLSVSKEFIGPITIGAFGLTNGIVGISVGINF